MYIKDIFYSIQGEGPYVGYPQIFIRFFGCNIHCAYCDEPDFAKDKKNISIETVKEQLAPFKNKPVHSISITGGEPLLHVDAIKTLKPILKHPLYLETNGTLPEHLTEVIDDFTYFAVDYKPGFQQEFTDFMIQLSEKKNLFVKYILTRDFPIQDIQFITKTLHTINKNIPFVIQPVTPFSGIKEKAKPDDIYRAYNCATKDLKDVRIIPQTHKFMGLK